MPGNEIPSLPKAKPKAKVKKPAVDKESKVFSSSCDGKSKCCESSSSSALQKSSCAEMYTAEIQAMMYGFGDCSRPLLESAKLVEEIVHQQLNSVMVLASETAANRGAKFIGYEDLLFIMRKDKHKLHRMLKYLQLKDSRSVQMKNLAQEEEDMDIAGCAETKPTPLHTKRVKLCLDFLNSIDEFGEYASILDDEFVDEIKLSREIRRDRHTIPMDEAQYLEYSEARQSSFCRKHRTTKFKDWLLKDNVTGFKPTAFALELLNYLAYEIVAQIVDLALLVKQDHEQDPFLRFQPLSAYNTDHPSTQFLTNSSKSVAVLESPTQGSPPPSPTTQSGGLLHPSTSSQTSTSPKPKPKKAKKSLGKTSYDFLSYNAIQPEHIRESISRYWTESGPFLLFSKCHKSNMRTRLLCC